MFWRRDKQRGGLLRRFKKNNKGVTAIEFAMVGGPFMYLMGCIFETGLMLFSEYVIENGVAQASRMIRTGQVQTEGMSAAQFKDEVCGRLASFLDCENNLHVDVRNFEAFADVSLPDPMDGDELSDDVTSDASFAPGEAMEVVVVRVYYEWELFMPGFTYLANVAGGKRLLTSGAAFRNEPFTAT